MKVVEQDGIFKASRITGPKHNYLGIGFSSDRNVDVQVVEKKLDQAPAVELVNAGDVLKVVHETVDRQTFGQERRLYVSIIEFVPTDTPDRQAYSELATVITRYALEVGACLQR